MIHIINNRKRISIAILAGFLAASIVVLSHPVKAEDAYSYSEPVNNCSQVESILKTKTDEFTQKRQSHLDKYSQISTLLSSATQSLADAGYDTAILTELKPGLDNRIGQFSDVSQTFLSEMSDANLSACRDEASFKQELEEARTSLKDVQNSVSDIQNYVQKVLIVAIKNVIAGGANQ